jgi:hypothetical protein
VIGFDIAKSVFQVQGSNAEGKVILRRQLKWRYVLPFLQKLPPCRVGIKRPDAASHAPSVHALDQCDPPAVINAIRAHLAEFGIVAPVGREGVEDLPGHCRSKGERVPNAARAASPRSARSRECLRRRS